MNTVNYTALVQKAEELISSNTRNDAEQALKIFESLHHEHGLKTPNVLTGIANAMMLMRRQDEAVNYYQEALAQDPLYFDALNGYSVYLIYRRDFEQAEKILRELLENHSYFSNAWINLGLILKGKSRYVESEKCLLRGLKDQPKSQAALNNLGLLYQDLGEFVKAQNKYQQALEFDPTNQTTRINLAMLYLNHQDWVEGWVHYESRLLKDGPTRFIDYPRWMGELLPNGSLLVLPEQGLGDMLLFSRYLSVARQRVKNVYFLCDTLWAKSLLRLMRTLEKQCDIKVITDGDPLPPFTAQIPLCSLARVCGGVPLSDVFPYLGATEDLKKHWKKRLGADNLPKKIKRVGLVWRSGGREKVEYDFLTQQRSISLLDMAPLAQLKDVVFYSLQLGAGTEELLAPPSGMQIIDHTSQITDMADTAALLSHLDALVSIDTSVPNLAGAMNIPTFLLKSFYPDWRWFNGPVSPWYPSVRVFKQMQYDQDWREVIVSLTSSLANFLQTI